MSEDGAADDEAIGGNPKGVSKRIPKGFQSGPQSLGSERDQRDLKGMPEGISKKFQRGAKGPSVP